MTYTQEQIAAACREWDEYVEMMGVPMGDVGRFAQEMRDMLEQLAADLLTICKREVAMIARYDAKLDALERAKPAGVLKGIDPQVISAARDLGEQEKQNPEWAFIDYEANQMSFGRWAKCGPNPAPYVRLDIALAALEPAPDAPVTVSSTEQDLGALVEHFKAKAEKAYADGVRDAAKVAEHAHLKRVEGTVGGVIVQTRANIAAAIRALLTEKDND